MSFGILKGRLPMSWDPATQGPVPVSFAACGDNEGTPASPPVTIDISVASMSAATRVKQLYDVNKQPIPLYALKMVNNMAQGYADLEMTIPGGVGVVMEAGCVTADGVFHGGSTNSCIFPVVTPPQPTTKDVRIISATGVMGGPVRVPFSITVDGQTVYQSVYTNPITPPGGGWGSW